MLRHLRTFWDGLAFWHWMGQLGIVLDQAANLFCTPFHGGAWADETLSCRAYRMWRDRKPWGLYWMPKIDWLFSWQKLRPDAIGHCHNAYLRELERYQMPPEMRPKPNEVTHES
jgi:hypothetical protein